MILINKSINENKVIVTVSELTTLTDAKYLLVLSSSYTKKTFRIELGENLSSHTNRYDEFLFNDLPDLEEGMYTYTIYQYSVEAIEEDAYVAETGTAKVISDLVDEVIELVTEEDEDDYIVYEGE